MKNVFLVDLISCVCCKKHIVSKIYNLDNIKNVMKDLNCSSNLEPVIVWFHHRNLFIKAISCQFLIRRFR